MEAIGVGANVLAFVVLGIKSAKLAHDTLSAIKDGPALVQGLAGNFLQLHWILEQLLQCRAAENDAALHGQARLCCEDLDKLAKTIERLQVPPKEKETGRFWKRLKAAISENDLKRLNDWVTQQAGMLNLRLSVLSSNAIYATRDGNERIQQQIHSMGASVEAQLESQTASFLSTTRSIATSHDDGRSALEASLSSIKHIVEAAHSISAEDTRSMFRLLNEIKDRMSPEPKADANMTNATGGEEQGGPPPGSDQKMLETIDSLCSLINEKRDAIDAYAEDDGQAQSAIENLDELVRNLREQELTVSDPKSFCNDLGRFRKWFGSGTLSINSGVETSQRPLTRVIEQSRNFGEADTGAGRFQLMVHKRKRAIGRENQDDDDTTAKRRCHTDWRMTVAYIPDQGQNHHMLCASLTRQELFANGMTCISRLQVNRVLPVGSPVFKLVKQGDLQGLKKMLQDGEASLQDHDEYGASLLFYSTRQPEMCKFLIDSGLNVDHVVCYNGVHPNPSLLQPLQVEFSWDEVASLGTAFELVMECRKLLLRAGADPTLATDEPSFLDHVHEYGASESIALLWNPEVVAPFADIKTYRNDSGMSSFLISCTNITEHTKEHIHQLLRLGANIRDRDDQGRSCLHTCFGNLRSPKALGQFDTIEYLLQQGADPRAVDNDGESVSEIAYTNMSWQNARNSYAGDLWDAVLHKCGHDISQFRSGHRRRARYTTPAHDEWSWFHYNRQDFESLWKGREAECPYWDDKPWPPLAPGEEDSDDESQDHECGCSECRPFSSSSMRERRSEYDSKLDKGEDEEQGGFDDASVGGHLCVDQDEQQSESDMGEATRTGGIESYWEETGTLPDFGELMRGMPSENWQASPDLGHSIIGTPRSLGMDLENPWL